MRLSQGDHKESHHWFESLHNHILSWGIEPKSPGLRRVLPMIESGYAVSFSWVPTALAEFLSKRLKCETFLCHERHADDHSPPVSRWLRYLLFLGRQACIHLYNRVGNTKGQLDRCGRTARFVLLETITYRNKCLTATGILDSQLHVPSSLTNS